MYDLIFPEVHRDNRIDKVLSLVGKPRNFFPRFRDAWLEKIMADEGTLDAKREIYVVVYTKAASLKCEHHEMIADEKCLACKRDWLVTDGGWMFTPDSETSAYGKFVKPFTRAVSNELTLVLWDLATKPIDTGWAWEKRLDDIAAAEDAA